MLDKIITIVIVVPIAIMIGFMVCAIPTDSGGIAYGSRPKSYLYTSIEVIAIVQQVNPEYQVCNNPDENPVCSAEYDGDGVWIVTIRCPYQPVYDIWRFNEKTCEVSGPYDVVPQDLEETRGRLQLYDR